MKDRIMITENEVREQIKKCVSDHWNMKGDGIKGTQLVADVMSKEIASSRICLDYVIYHMLKDGEIREEEYTDPAIPYRIKSKYFPV